PVLWYHAPPMRRFLSVAVTAAAAGELERGLAALSAAAEVCASRGDAAGVAFARCIED
ncbi:dpy-18, partial [Symbiodinium sp. CCMP2456]